MSCLPDNVQMLTYTAALHTGFNSGPPLRQRQSAVLDLALFPKLHSDPVLRRVSHLAVLIP